MTNNRLLLVKCITLLYRESKVVDRTENSADLVRTVLETIKLPEQSLSINHDRELLMGIKDTALYMCGNPLEFTYDQDEILQRLKVNCGDDVRLFEAFAQGIERDMEEKSLKNTILQIRSYISDTFREDAASKLINDASRDLIFNRSKIKSVREFVRDLCIKLEPFQLKSNKKDPAIVSSVDIGDTAGMKDVFDEVHAAADGTALLRTGWHGINRMLQGGFRRGESWVIGALQHKFKTGFSLTLFKQLAIYNKPLMINPSKKPLMIRISFEDNLPLNFQFLYQNLWQNEHGTKPSIKDVTASQMSAYIQEKMQVTGYHIKLLRVNPSDWTYKDVQNYILEMEANGYEVHVLMLDYLPMLPTTGCEDGPMGHAMRDMYRRMRNFCSPRKICMITPHQFSTEAKMLIREGHLDFVKKVNENGYYAGSKQIDQEVDGELSIHIEKAQGRAYLTVQRGKHRIPTIIKDDDKYCVLPFPEDGSIPDDLNGPEITLLKVGGAPIGQDNAPREIAWAY